MTPTDNDSLVSTKGNAVALAPPRRDEGPLPSTRDLFLLFLNCGAAFVSASIVLRTIYDCYLLDLQCQLLAPDSGARIDYSAAQWLGYATIVPNVVVSFSVITVGYYGFFKRKLPLLSMIMVVGVALSLGLADAAILYIARHQPFAIELCISKLIPGLVAPCTYCVFVFLWLLTGPRRRLKKKPVDAVGLTRV